MTRQGRWLFIFVLLSFVVGLMFGLRFATTFGDSFRRIFYVPVPVRDTLTWDMNNHVSEHDGSEWQYVWPLPSSS